MNFISFVKDQKPHCSLTNHLKKTTKDYNKTWPFNHKPTFNRYCIKMQVDFGLLTSVQTP